jgi:predicted transcriptional regulator YheO
LTKHLTNLTTFFIIKGVNVKTLTQKQLARRNRNHEIFNYYYSPGLPERLKDIEIIAGLFHVSPRTVYRAIKNGKK